MVQRLLVVAFLLTLCAAQSAAAVGTGYKAPLAPPISTEDGEGDQWGYTWIRSDSGGPEFNWVDISTIGTQVTGLTDDNNVGPFSIGFDFQYYWYTVTQFRIGSNGYLSFGNQTANFASPFAMFENVAPPNDMICAMGGDLDFTVAATNALCYYWTNGIDSCVVSYIDVTEWQATPNPNLKHTFQFIICGADSSITFQYGEQQGQFNSVQNTTLSIGIENQTGTIGLSYYWGTIGPHPRHPYDGLAIKWRRTVDTGLEVTDAGVVGGFDSENLGRIFQLSAADTVTAVVKNFGTVDLTNVRVSYAISKAGQSTARDTVFLATLLASEEVSITFPRLFTPAVSGSYTATFTTFVAGDIGPGNDNRSTEIRSANFSLTANTRLSFDTNVIGGSINWSGGAGGMAVDFEVPVAQVRIESVFVDITTINTPGSMLTVEILEDAGGVPGAVLATRNTSSVVVGNNGISFVSDSVRITGGRFFVGARGDFAFSYETTAPIAFRTWEYTNGYAPYRSRDLQDVLIRAGVRMENPPTPDPDVFSDGFEAYTAGQQLVLQNNTDWDTWSSLPGSGEDPFVSNAFAYGGSNSVVIAQNNDLVRYHDQRTTGSWGISFQMYIPSGQSGYFNTLSGFTPNPFYWAMEVYFDAGGAGRLLTGDPVTNFNWTEDTWQQVEVIVDLDQDLAQFVFDGTVIHQWTWTLGASGGTGPLRLDANDFFGATAADEMYFDDYNFMADTLRPTVDVTPGQEIPVDYVLNQNYPNPFNPSTIIRFALPQQSTVALKVYNIIGQEVATLVNEVRPAGYHAVAWNGTTRTGQIAATGIYFFRLEAKATDGNSGFKDLKKMILVK